MKPARAHALRALLDPLEEAAPATRVNADPVRFPRRYQGPRDIEVAGLVAAALAYGRVDLFAPKVETLLDRMGPSPAGFLRDATDRQLDRALGNFVYRFNVRADLAVLLVGIQRALQEHGSLEALFLHGRVEGDLHASLAAFTRALRRAEDPALRRRFGPTRGVGHLLPSPLGPGAAKRLNLFLRWMVRGPDEVDLGIWTRLSPAELVIPLDTHIARMARHLGLTRRRDLSWKTALEITRSLRALCPDDPVRYDFALCHFGMSGACPPRVRAAHCAGCRLRSVCLTGRRLARPPRLSAHAVQAERTRSLGESAPPR